MQSKSYRTVLPEVLETPRLLLSAPEFSHAEELYQAIVESFAALQPWMSWAGELPTSRYVESYILESRRRFSAAEEFPLLLIERESGLVVGGSGLHQIDWYVPKAEIGYWIRTSHQGRGLVTEAVAAIADAALHTLQMQRLEIRTSSKNRKSQEVAQRAGFRREGSLANDRRERDGSIGTTILYAKTK